MGSLRSAGTWPHPNHKEPIIEEETEEKRERERIMQQKGPQLARGQKAEKGRKISSTRQIYSSVCNCVSKRGIESYFPELFNHLLSACFNITSCILASLVYSAVINLTFSDLMADRLVILKMPQFIRNVDNRIGKLELNCILKSN